MANRLKPRGDTAANWTLYNPTLAKRELAFELDTTKIKVGDGVTAWNDLNYYSIGGDAINVGYNFTNGQLEANCNDWNLYADAAGTTPVDGTGGTATITKAWNGTSPLNGKGDMLITKPASNCQGNGVSKDFSIDAGQLGKVAQLDFDYLVSSAYVSGYANVSLYDVTNAKFVTVSVSDIAATFGSIARHSLLFIPNANSNYYRLCLHVADATSTAWTLRADNFQLGNWKTFSAPVVSPWVDYTPTFTGFGTVTILKAQWKRDGEDILLSIKIVVGTPTAVEAQMTLPNAYTSRANVPTLEEVGKGNISVGSASQFLVLSEPSKNYVTFGAQAASLAGLQKLNGNTLFGASGISFSFDARIPCAQFSINTTFVGVNEPFYLSNSETVANTNGVVGKTKLGIDGSPILANTALTYYDMTLPRKLLQNEKPTFEVRSKVDGEWHDASMLGVPSLFVTRISAVSDFVVNSQPTNYIRGVFFAKISSGILRVYIPNSVHHAVSWADGALQGDVTWAQVTSAADGVDAWRVRIGQASTGAEIAPAIRALCTGESTAHAANGIVKPSAKVYDTNDSWDLSTGLYTVKVAGLYQVKLSGYPGNYPGECFVKKSGVQYPASTSFFTGSNSSLGAAQISGTIDIDCYTGDTIGIYCDLSGTFTAGSWFQITRIGN